MIPQDTSKGEPYMVNTLFLSIQLTVPCGETITGIALLDTGAEYNLCWSSFIPHGCCDVSQKPLRFLAADQTSLVGGKRQLQAHVLMGCLDDQGPRLQHHMTFELYEADIQSDISLSYSWMVEHQVMICPRQQVIILCGLRYRLWIHGSRGLHKEENRMP